MDSQYKETGIELKNLNKKNIYNVQQLSYRLKEIIEISKNKPIKRINCIYTVFDKKEIIIEKTVLILYY